MSIEQKHRLVPNASLSSHTMPRLWRKLVDVTAPCGQIIGTHSVESGNMSFLGIPYAVAPNGSRRFKQCEPRARFDRPLIATDFGPASAQVFDPKEADLSEFQQGAIGHPTHVGREDSLSLNVWTPGCDGKERPVIVFIHGGANWLESSRLSTYSGETLSACGGVIVVTLNYRLGLLGALDLSALGGDAPPGAHANCVRDQLCALDWVRQNIRAFGGNPGNVTVVGESAGSMDISWMIAAGALKGRARRAVLMSGVGSVVGFGHNHESSAHHLIEGQRRARNFLQRLNIRSYEELRRTKTSELLRRCSEVAKVSDILFEMDTLFYPRVDGIFTAKDPFMAASEEATKDLDILIGFTGYELGLWLNWDEELDKRSAGWAAEKCPFFPRALRSQLAKLYEREFSRKTTGVQGMHLLSDSMFGAPSLIFAERAARANRNCWMYRFDYPCSDPRRGALHAADMCFFLGTWDTNGGRGLLGPCSTREAFNERQRLSTAMQESLISFARDGDPNTRSLPGWPRFTSSKQEFMRFDLRSESCQEPLGGRGQFWLEKVAAPVLGR